MTRLNIATWNINGIKARLEGVRTWLQQQSPDMVCVQEIKSVDENFPKEMIEDLGYNVVTHGQKSFNGVAIFSKYPFVDIQTGLPGDATDDQARFLRTSFDIHGQVLDLVSLYLPNGNPVHTEKFSYKLGFMDRLNIWAKKQLNAETPLIIAGDYNIIPRPIDCHDPKAWWGDALFCAPSLDRFRALENMGFVDAIRTLYDTQLFSFWDFQAGAWRRNHGIRIDHHMLSPRVSDWLVGAQIHQETRGWDKPSDHVPVTIELDVPGLKPA